MEKQNKQLELVKEQILESISQKFFNISDDFQSKDICEHLNLSEQTFFAWKRKNPIMVKTLIDGYRYKIVIDELKELCSIVQTQKIIKKRC